MRRTPGGYTIIEVMIFLAVSAFLMLAAWRLIGGKQGQVTFSQQVSNAQSQLQSWISDVSNGYPGADPTQTHCTAPTNGRPIVQSGPAPTNTSPTCVFLGKAIQFPPVNSSNIYAYSVFGNNAFNGELPTNLTQSNPEPAIGQSAPSLTETFNLYPLYVKRIVACRTITSLACNSYLLGFYNSINSENLPTGNNENDLNAYEYNFSGTPANIDNSTVQSCIEMGSPCFSNPPPSYPDKLQVVTYCLTDGTSRTAELSIISSSGLGASVQIKYTNC